VQNSGEKISSAEAHSFISSPLRGMSEFHRHRQAQEKIFDGCKCPVQKPQPTQSEIKDQHEKNYK
jgi:hypothetical protein